MANFTGAYERTKLNGALTPKTLCDIGNASIHQSLYFSSQPPGSDPKVIESMLKDAHTEMALLAKGKNKDFKNVEEILSALRKKADETPNATELQTYFSDGKSRAEPFLKRSYIKMQDQGVETVLDSWMTGQQKWEKSFGPRSRAGECDASMYLSGMIDPLPTPHNVQGTVTKGKGPTRIT